MQRYQNVAQDALGNAIQAMNASVFLRGTQTLASLFSDAAGTLPITNPVVTDALGNFAFYAANARYDVQLSKTNLPTTILPDIILFDPFGGGSGPLINGDVLFGAAGSFGQDANFFWDNTNKRLGIGNNAPANSLHVTSPSIITDAAIRLTAAGFREWQLRAKTGTAEFAITDLGGGPVDWLKVGVTGAVSIPGSVVTPLVVSAAVSTPLTFTVNGERSWIIGTNAGNSNSLTPSQDNAQNIGQPSFRVVSVFATAIDSGSPGSLSLQTNNGTPQAVFSNSGAHTISQNALSSTNTFSNIITQFQTNGSGRDVSINLNDVSSTSHLISGKSGLLSFGGLGPQIHFQIGPVTGASTRWLTATGGNGVNAQLGTNAGGVDFTSSTIRYPNIGTTANAANATLNAVGSNDLLRSTSSLRYKTDVQDVTDADLEVLEHARAVRYRSASMSDDRNQVHLGLLAEDVARLNSLLVTLGDVEVADGVYVKAPDWVQYERFIPLLIEQGRRDRKRIAALEARVR